MNAIQSGYQVSQPQNPNAGRIVFHQTKNNTLPIPNIYLYAKKEHLLPPVEEGEEVGRGGFDIVGQIQDVSIYKRAGYLDRTEETGEKNEVNLRLTLVGLDGASYPMDITLADLRQDSFNNVGMQILDTLAEIGHNEDENFKNHYFKLSLWSVTQGDRTYPRVTTRYPVNYDESGTPVFDNGVTLRLATLPPQPEKVIIEGVNKPVYKTGLVLQHLNESIAAVREIWPEHNYNQTLTETEESAETAALPAAKAPDATDADATLSSELADALDTDGLGDDLDEGEEPTQHASPKG